MRLAECSGHRAGTIEPTHQPAQCIGLIAFGIADLSEFKNRLIKKLRSSSNRAVTR